MRLRPLNVKIGVLICTFILIFAKASPAGGADEPVVKNLSVDKKNKTISYVLTEPATVRIRVGSKSGPLHRTLVNWEKQENGSHTIKWDGMDASKAFNILDNNNFTFSFNYYLAGKEKQMISDYLDNELIISDYFIGRAPKLLHLSQNHKNHKKEHCRDLEALFKLSDNIQKTKDGLPKVKGVSPIIIELPDRDKFWFRQERFSLNIFIDDVFVWGEALGYTPYAWNFNPKGINEGRHLITVNLKGFNDHMAVGSLPIYVEK